MKMNIIKDKLMYYVGFLDSFIESGKTILRDYDIQQLKMLREYVIEAHNIIKKIVDLND